MRVSAIFIERIRTTTDISLLQQELNVIRRIVIEETSPQRRDELCLKQRYIEERLFELTRPVSHLN